MAFGLREQFNFTVHAKVEFAHIDEDNRSVRGRCACHHIARVLLVPWGVGNDVFAARCGEVTICHVDGDALFALGFQSIGEQCQIHTVVV